MPATFKPTDEQRRQVELMAAVGVSQYDIAQVLDIAEKTLRKAFREELDKGIIKANAKVGANLLRMACGDGREALVAAIYWTKTRMGWVEGIGPPRETVGLKRWRQQTGEQSPDPDSAWSRLVDVDPRKPN
jgi:hypothetical protein